MEETRVIYHLEDQDTPYLVRVNVPAQRVTLADLKQVLNKQNHKYFFKSVDDDFGVVKEEISDDDVKLPCINGRVVCWVSDLKESGSVDSLDTRVQPTPHRTGGIGDSRPPSFHGQEDELQKRGDTIGPHLRQSPPVAHLQTSSSSVGDSLSHRGGGRQPPKPRDVQPPAGDSRCHPQSSELDTSSLTSSEEDSGGRFSQSSSSPKPIRRQRRRHRQPKNPHMDKSESLSSVTDSSMSLTVVTVTLDMEKHNFLGISIVGQSNERGDGGIFIGSIMKGGAVAADARIEPGDMLLQVNDINFENTSNDDAVRILREVVHQPGPVTLTVAKCWETSPRCGLTLPRSEPVRPIDPAAWVSHTAAMTGRLLPHYSVHEDVGLNVHSDMEMVVKLMSNPESGVEVRDRLWLKITIPHAFIGSDVVDWLLRNVDGFVDRREARKYAANLLKSGYIRHAVNKQAFSEQCYYVFGDVCADVSLSRRLDEPSCQSRVSPPTLVARCDVSPTWVGEAQNEGGRAVGPAPGQEADTNNGDDAMCPLTPGLLGNKGAAGVASVTRSSLRLSDAISGDYFVDVM